MERIDFMCECKSAIVIYSGLRYYTWTKAIGAKEQWCGKALPMLKAHA